MVTALERIPFVAPPRGLVTVELTDAATGRLVQREQAENFLTLDSLEVARWFQRMLWGANNPVEPANADGWRAKQMPPFMAQHLACWNDATDEDPTTEHRVERPVTAWASRAPVGSPTGKRGVVNITESEFTDDHAKWVFDWATSAGNGTFRSVGWTRLYEPLDAPLLRYPEDGWIEFSGLSVGNWQGGFYWDGANWITIDWDSAGTQHRLRSIPAAGGAPTTIFNIPTTAFRLSASLCPFGITKIGTDWYICGGDVSADQPRVAKLNAAGAQQWAVTRSDIAGQHIFADITTDGTNLFVGCTNGKVYRLSPADGSITATITPAWVTVAAPYGGVQGIAYDPDDGNLWVVIQEGSNLGSFVKMATDGTLVGPQMIYSVAGQSVASTTPFAGNYVIPGTSAKDPYQLSLGSSTAADEGNYENETADAWPSTGTAPPNLFGTFFNFIGGTNWGLWNNITLKGDELWLSPHGPAGAVVQWGAIRIAGHNMATRVRLPADITKTNAQTMKVTYQFDF